jgi:hypothetical protein
MSTPAAISAIEMWNCRIAIKGYAIDSNVPIQDRRDTLRTTGAEHAWQTTEWIRFDLHGRDGSSAHLLAAEKGSSIAQCRRRSGSGSWTHGSRAAGTLGMYRRYDGSWSREPQYQLWILRRKPRLRFRLYRSHWRHDQLRRFDWRVRFAERRRSCRNGWGTWKRLGRRSRRR